MNLLTGKINKDNKLSFLNKCMEIAISPGVLWNIFLTLVVLPMGFLVRTILSEQKRIDILVNKTREEIAREYVTRDQIEIEFQRIIDKMDKLDSKLDRVVSKTYFQE